MFKDLNIWHDIMKLLEKNKGKTFSDINCTNIFLGQSSKAIEKSKINKWDLIKLKSFCTAKDTINKERWHCSEGRKYLQTMQPKTGLTSKIYKQLTGNTTTEKPPNQKMGKKT